MHHLTFKIKSAMLISETSHYCHLVSSIILSNFFSDEENPLIAIKFLVQSLIEGVSNHQGLGGEGRRGRQVSDIVTSGSGLAQDPDQEGSVTPESYCRHLSSEKSRVVLTLVT